MVKVFSPGRRDPLFSDRLAASLVLTLTLAVPGQVWSQATKPVPATKPAAPPPAAPSPAEKAKADTKPDVDTADTTPPPDPSKTGKSAPLEVFKDPIAEELLDLKKFPATPGRPATTGDIAQFKLMAGDPNTPVNPTVIRQVVDGLIAQLTDHKNIQALIDPPPGLNPNSATARAIQEATTTLLEPIFAARAAKNSNFQIEYNKILLQRLQPLITKAHLIPRVQAAIVLGQSGCSEALRLFLDELKSTKQTVWVKLWCLRGITNIKQFATSARLSASQEIEASRQIADLLNKNKELPWWVQLRALEAMAILRQGFLPTAPSRADMASAAMRLLADPEVRPEVRAEAALALGMMQITTAVPKYNFGLVAHSVGEVAAKIGDEILASFSGNKTKGEYLTSLLVGQIHQAFEGQPAARDSGLLRGAPQGVRGDIQAIADAVKQVERGSLDLIGASTGQIAARRTELAARVAALKDLLSKNPPAERHLVPGGPEYGAGGANVAEKAEADVEPASAEVAGGRGGR